MAKRRTRRKARRLPESDGLPDTADDVARILELERRRSGPGTAARRALETLAEQRRLRRQLEDLDGF